MNVSLSGPAGCAPAGTTQRAVGRLHRKGTLLTNVPLAALSVCVRLKSLFLSVTGKIFSSSHETRNVYSQQHLAPSVAFLLLRRISKVGFCVPSLTSAIQQANRNFKNMTIYLFIIILS